MKWIVITMMVVMTITHALMAMDNNKKDAFANAYFWRKVNSDRLKEVGTVDDLAPMDWKHIMKGTYVEVFEHFIPAGSKRAFLVGTKSKRPNERGYWWVIRKYSNEVTGETIKEN